MSAPTKILGSIASAMTDRDGSEKGTIQCKPNPLPYHQERNCGGDRTGIASEKHYTNGYTTITPQKQSREIKTPNFKLQTYPKWREEMVAGR